GRAAGAADSAAVCGLGAAPPQGVVVMSLLRSCNHLSRLLASAIIVFCSRSAYAQGAADDEDVFFRNDPGTGKYAVIITGAAASDEIAERFSQWSLALHDILGRDYGYGSDAITLLLGDGAGGERPNPRIDGSSRREDIESALAELAGQVRGGDQVTFILIGHGSSLGEEAKFNIVGPDITGPEFAVMLEQFNQHNVVVI